MVPMRVQCRRWRLSMNRPTPTPPRRGPVKAPLLGGERTEIPSWEGRGGFRVALCARSPGWSLPGEKRAGRAPRRREIPANRPPVPSPPSDGREGAVLARSHSEMRMRRLPKRSVTKEQRRPWAKDQAMLRMLFIGGSQGRGWLPDARRARRELDRRRHRNRFGRLSLGRLRF